MFSVILHKDFSIATYKMSNMNYDFVDKQSQIVNNSIVFFITL